MFPVVGYIDIVSKNKQSYSLSSKALSTLSAIFNSNLAAVCSGADTELEFKMSGTVTNYNDGSKYGEHTNILGSLEAEMGLPNVEIPLWDNGIVGVQLALNFGNFSCTGSIEAVRDESQSSPYSGSATVSFGLTGLSGSLEAYMGLSNICELVASGTVTAGSIKLEGTGTVDSEDVELELNFVSEPLTLVFEVDFKTTIDDLECNLYTSDSYTIIDSTNMSLGSATIYSFD